LDQGRLLAFGTPEELDKKQDNRLQQFISSDTQMKNYNVLVGSSRLRCCALWCCAFLIGNQHKAFHHHIVFYTKLPEC